MIPGNDDLSDFSMMDLFRSEMEVHTAVLNDSLLALENGTSVGESIDASMRAAHSIKGGARIVELEPVEILAHTMEDCFVAAQKGQITLDSDAIDLLFQAVDMLKEIAESANDDESTWIENNQAQFDQLVSAIESVATGKKISLKKGSNILKKTVPHPDEQPAPTPEPTPKPAADDQTVPAEKAVATDDAKEPVEVPESPKQPDACEVDHVSDTKKVKDRMIRVTAMKIDRLMALAGEVVVGTRWLPAHFQALMVLKNKQMDLLNIFERACDQIRDENSGGRSLRLMGKCKDKLKECHQFLMDKISELDIFVSNSENLSDRLYHEVIGVRMRPFADGVHGFPRMVRDLARQLGKKVNFMIDGKNTEVDRDILEKLEAPLIHLIRNAVDHGIESPEDRVSAGKPETGTIRLEAYHRSGMLMITISDDGRGIDFDKLRNKILKNGLASQDMVAKLTEQELIEFLFLPGFSTVGHVSEISGRGVGLDVVHNMVHEVGGVVRAISQPGAGMTFQLELPLTLSVIRTFIVEVAGETYAFPLARIDRCLHVPVNQIEVVEDRQYFQYEEKNIALVDIHDVMNFEQTGESPDPLKVVILSDRLHAYGLVVDDFIGECDLVVRPLDARLGKVSNIAAMALMLDGMPVLIFDVEDLIRSIDGILSGKKRLQKVTKATAEESTLSSKLILVVDDSITVREMERKLLESKGYRVDVAVDGMDAWNMVRTADYDMVITDIDMPRLNGIELIKNIKKLDRLKSLPIMVVSYKNKEEDRLRGLEAGANYYLTKNSFQDNSFINAVIDLIGEA